MRKAAGLIIGLIVMASTLAGCATPYQQRGLTGGYEDLDIGGNRYLISVRANAVSGIGTAEQYFHRRALEIAKEHGFERYRVIEFRSGFEPNFGGFKPFAKGTIELYGGTASTAAQSTANAKPGTLLGTGTGFVVSADGVLLTNEHVVHGCGQVSIRQPDGTTAGASVLAVDPTNDLALLRIPGATPELAQFRGNADLRQGESVIAVGFPLRALLSSGTTLTTGTVSALAGIKNDSRQLQISAPVQPGNSGGPLLDQAGNVVGVVNAKLNSLAVAAATGDIPQNVNFAIKASVARAFMEANAIAYRSTASDKPLSTAEVGDQARKFTALVLCMK